ncbi:Arginine--tRNA ligase, cytoplasmic [Madurella mycetomatis]|uniref:arginine--tRNA ligase n=1 Tax=Madurella mycetomatis TaxID=100816 RepID=A0A175WHD6_9PEZI|nr:Arginine--tRNA ligase, cytoplasmic [Madurella mycetomatis]
MSPLAESRPNHQPGAIPVPAPASVLVPPSIPAAGPAPDPTSFVRVRTTLPRQPLPPIAARGPITTQRLLLRPLAASDLDAIHVLRTQPEVMYWTSTAQIDASLDETRAKLARYLPPGDGQTYNCAICLGGSGEVIGMGGVHNWTSSLGWPEVGYMIRREYWGKGLGTEFLRGFLEGVWEGLEREEVEMAVDARTVVGGRVVGVDGVVAVPEQLVAITVKENEKSRKVLEKTGFELFVTWKERDATKGGADEDLQTYLGELGVPIPIPTYPSANPLYNPNDIYRSYIAAALEQLTDCDRVLLYESLQRTSTPSKGDIVLVLPRLRLKSVKPDDLGVELASKFPVLPLVNPPIPLQNHLQFFYSPRILPRLILPFVSERKASYGSSMIQGQKKRAIVEFSSPNIAKEFHAGHLRSTIIGAFIANLYENMGWDVVRINYLGDWGKQFGLLAVGWEKYGSEELLQSEPLKHLLDVYVKINAEFKPEEAASKKARDEGRDTAEIESRGLFSERNAFFKRMELGNQEALALWKRFRDISIERYIDIYARLGINFDVYAGESQVNPAAVAEVESLLKERGVYKEDKGSWMIDFTKHGAKHLGTAILRGRTGTTTYLLRDVAAILDREKQYSFDEMIYVVSSEQDLYFQRVFKTVELLGYPDLAAKLKHVNFGKVLGMSSRLGKVELLSDILDKCGIAMHNVMRANAVKYSQVEDPDTVADTVGITAVMVQDMSGKRNNNYPFDINRMTSFEGDTGPYLQYCHARLSSILRKAKLTAINLADGDIDYSYLEDDYSAGLIRIMAQYPDVVATAFKNLEPSTILTYLFRLTHQLSSSYDVLQDIKETRACEEHEDSKAPSIVAQMQRTSAWEDSSYYIDVSHCLRQHDLLAVGFDNPDKSTMMQRIRNIEELGQGPTPSEISEELRIGRTTCTMLSVGEELPRPWWRTSDYLADVLGVMFVVDATDPNGPREASREIQYLIRQLPDVPFSQNGNSTSHWGMFDRISLLLGAPVTLKICSILNRQGYQEAFKWLIERI